MTTSSTLLTVARAQALFVSDLSAESAPTRAEITDAVSRMVRVYHGTRGCLEQVACAYGEHPELAAPRMSWALRCVRAVDWKHASVAVVRELPGTARTARPARQAA